MGYRDGVLSLYSFVHLAICCPQVDFQDSSGISPLSAAVVLGHLPLTRYFVVQIATTPLSAVSTPPPSSADLGEDAKSDARFVYEFLLMAGSNDTLYDYV